MCTASIYEAKTQLSKYIAMLENGQEEEIVILKNGKQVAKIVPILPEDEEVRLGAGLLYTSDKPFAPNWSDDEITELFGY